MPAHRRPSAPASPGASRLPGAHGEPAAARGGNGSPRRRRWTLFVDADDTLWENNVYFEAVVGVYCDLVGARGVTADLARQTLLDIERVRTRLHGYGIANFNQSLRQACRELIGDDSGAVVAELDARCEAIRYQKMELIAGVEETLRELASRHRLVMFTKGDEADQCDKVSRSGLAGWFSAVDVVGEKHPAAYREALARHGVEARDCWMIGNSPRSDISPALAAGLGAVFVPHPGTWVLELDPLPEGGHERLLVLERFEQLTDHF